MRYGQCMVTLGYHTSTLAPSLSIWEDYTESIHTYITSVVILKMMIRCHQCSCVHVTHEPPQLGHILKGQVWQGTITLTTLTTTHSLVVSSFSWEAAHRNTVLWWPASFPPSCLMELLVIEVTGDILLVAGYWMTLHDWWLVPGWIIACQQGILCLC